MKKLVVLSGAGISAESGISTFRDAGGLWDKYPVAMLSLWMMALLPKRVHPKRFSIIRNQKEHALLFPNLTID